MKKYCLFLLLAAPLFGFSQNNAPVAVNDTFYVDFNDSIWSVEIMYPTVSVGLLLENDSDPDGDRANITGIIYSGSNSIQLDSMAPGNTQFRFKSLNGFIGIDSLQYIITDHGTLNMSDTAWVYIKVKHAEIAYLDLNNIKAGFGLNQVFNNPLYGTSSFEVPKGDSSHTVFAANLWLAGINQDSVHNSSMMYGSTSISNPQKEFIARSGPIMDSMYYPEYSYKWDRHWKVNASDITYHINNYTNSGYTPIEVIRNWPAHGDISRGQALNLAPFFDNNSDGFYDPMDGDYPLIKGSQAVYFIYNDIRFCPNSWDRPLNVEIHYMAYAYNCSSDSALNNTIFMDYTIFNRSQRTYDSTYVGFWLDFDLGCPTDDYLGSDVSRSTYYAYNADGFDEQCFGASGYLNNPPYQAVTFLKGPQQDIDAMDNPLTQNVPLAISLDGMVYPNQGLGFGDGIIDNEFWGLEHFISNWVGFGPTNIGDFHKQLQSIFPDGAHQTWGGNGHPASSGGNIPAHHAYPGISDPLYYSTEGITATPIDWNELTALNPIGDRRGVGSSGPFTFLPGGQYEITLAFVFGRDYQNTGNLAGKVIMEERVDSIHSYFRNGFTTTACGQTLSVNEKELDENDLSIYPNPFSNQLTVEYALENESGEIRIISLYGQVIQNQVVNQNKTTIDLSELANGIYLVQLIDGNKIISKRVLKQ